MSPQNKKTLNNIYELVFQKSPVAKFIYSVNGDIQNINNSALEFLEIESIETLRELNLFENKFLDRRLLNSLPIGETIKYCFKMDFDEIRLRSGLKSKRTGIAYVEVSVTPLGEQGILIQSQEFTSQQNTLASLMESEKLFKLLADNAPVLIWMSGPDKKCTYFNKGWLDFTGRKIELEIGDGWAENVHPEDLSFCIDTYTKSFDLKQPFTMEYRLKRFDGEFRWILDSGVPRFLNNNEFAGYIGSCVDITEQKNAGMALAESEEKFRKIFNNGPIGASIASLVYQYILVNDAFCELVGYSKDELVGMTIMDITHPQDVRIGAKYTQKLISEEIKQAVFTKRYISKNEKIVWVQISITLLRNNCGEPLFFFQLVENITRRKMAEKRIMHSEQKYRNLIENAPLGVCIVSSYKTVFCNHKFKEMLECDSVNQIYNHSILEFVHKDDWNIVVGSHLLRFEKKATYPFTYEHRIITAKGSLRHWKVFNTEYYIDDKRYNQGIVFDITEELKLEKQRNFLLSESLFIERKNKLAENLKKIISKTIGNYNLKEKDKRRIDKIFNQFLNNDLDWKRFNIHFETIHGDYLKRLKKAYPNLTQNELHHCAFIKLKFSTKDIALLNNVRDTSVQRSRVRLKKKLALSKEHDLFSFLECF